MTDFVNGKITDRGYEFSDALDFKVISYSKECLEKIKDDYPGAFKPMLPGEMHPSGLGLQTGNEQQHQVKNGLVAKIAATHAGLITRNNGFYMPDKMREGTSTWTDIYPKPMQVHHEDHNDPVGRVIAAKYVEYIPQVADKFKNHVLRDSRTHKKIGTADLKFWKDFSSSKTPFIEKLQMIKLMDSVLHDKHYRGVGYIETTVNITDLPTIEKVLDGRYLTVSVGAVSDKAVCSVCNTNWIEEEHCGHMPGKMYDGKKCFVIAGSLEYDELSWVNTPADRHGRILSIESNSIRDNFKTSKDMFFMYPIADNFNKEDTTMADANNVAPTTNEIEDEAEKAKSNEASEAKVEDSTQEPAEQTTESAATVEAEAIIEDSDKSSEPAEKTPTELAFKNCLSLEPSVSETDSQLIYDAMSAELAKIEEIKDSILSLEQLKKLPGSVFCGPGRTFPVMDQAHYTAARAVLDSLEDSELNKAQVDKALERKAKALGFVSTKSTKDSKEADKPVEEKTTIKDGRLTTEVVQNLLNALDTGLYGSPWSDTKEAPVLSDEESNELRSLIAALVKRIGKDKLSEVVVDLGLGVTKDELEVQISEAIKLEDSLGQKTDQLSALRQELTATYTDLAMLQDQLVSANTKLRSQKLKQLETLQTLDGSINDEVKAKMVTFSDEVLDNSLENLLNKVDINKIADKVNNGLAKNNVNEKVDNPIFSDETEHSIESAPTTNQSAVAFATQDRIDSQYRHYLVVERNPNKARDFYIKMQDLGLATKKF